MKKIGILIYSLAGGGAERVVSTLLRALNSKNHIILFLMNDKIAYKIPPEVEVCYIEKSNPKENGILKLIKLPWLGYKYYRYCIKHRIDISLSFMYRSNYINIISGLLGSKCKIIISERNYPANVYKSNTSLKDFISKLLIRYLYPKADIIIPNSLASKESLINDFKINTKIEVIYNPINIKEIQRLSSINLDFDFKKFTYITIGSLHHQKNHELLIKSFSKIKNKDTQLLIIGEGQLKDKLKSLIKNLHLKQRVFLLGFKSNPFKYLTRSNCFVLTSNFEGFPNVMLEALICKLPIISTDCFSGPREILAPDTHFSNFTEQNIIYGEFGILVPKNHSIQLTTAMDIIETNSSLRAKYISKSFKRGSEFKLTNIINQFNAVLCLP